MGWNWMLCIVVGRRGEGEEGGEKHHCRPAWLGKSSSPAPFWGWLLIDRLIDFDNARVYDKDRLAKSRKADKQQSVLCSGG
jgi:hypothetical protein